MNQNKSDAVVPPSADAEEDLVTYEEAADLIGVGYWQVADYVSRGGLRPQRRRGEKRKFLPRAEVTIYAELRRKTRQELERELLNLRLRGHAHPPGPPTSSGSPMGERHHAGTVPGGSRSPGDAPSPEALRTVFRAWLEESIQGSAVRSRRKALRRPPGHEPTLPERVSAVLATIGPVVVLGLVETYMEGLDDSRWEQTWQRMLSGAETDPVLRSTVDEIQRRALNPPQATTPVDPRELPVSGSEPAGKKRPDQARQSRRKGTAA